MNYSLTNPQNSIWLTEKFYTGQAVNNICGYVYIPDKVDFNVLSKAINEVVKTNDNMRLKFKEENNSCVQYLNAYQKFSIDTIEVSSEKDIEIKALEMANVPFEIKDNFLFKFILFKLPNNSGGFIVNLHHIIGDSWALGLVAKEITGIYSDILNNSYEEKEFPSYLKYINFEKEYFSSEKYIKDKEYWNEIFKTIPEVASVPSTQETNHKNVSCKGAREKFVISEKQVNDIKEFCAKNKISVYNFFMAIYSLYVGKVSSLDDFVIGTPILNRTNFEQKHTMGMFISTVPLRINLEHEKSFSDFCKTIASNSMSLLRHQKYPYQSLLEDLRKKDTSIPNLYNVILSYQITKTVEENSSIKYSTDWIFNGNSADDLQIHLFDLNDESSITVAYDYKTDKYDNQDIADLHERILTIINQVMSNNDIILKDIEIVTPEEKHQILYEFNNTKVDYPRDKTIVDLFEEQVEKTPDNIAVVFEDQKLTYRELNEKANQLANYLISKNVKNGDVVSILFDRSLEILISILAVLKTGAAYLPLDPNYPKDRLDYIFNDCKSKYILTTDITKMDSYSNVIIYNCIDNSFENYDSSNLKLNIPVSSPSYLIYTSGSTGTPKGVILKHLSLTNLAYYCNDNIEYLKKSEYISIVSITTVSFDIFIFETLISLQKGLKVVIANTKQQNLPVELNKLIEKENIKAIQTTPSRIQAFYNNLDILNNLKNLNYIILAGEQLPVELAQKLHSISGAKIYNGYGPSETTVFATLTDVTNKVNQMTIGKPLSNTQIYILDKNKNLCPIGMQGEIYIAGDDVGLGYVNKHNLTNESFIENPFLPDSVMYKSGDLGYYNSNGEIICLGRIDNQVKIRGLRIELEEIENVIRTSSNINNCIVYKVKNLSGNDCLCAYFTQIGPVDISVLKATLYKRLPNYMVPEFYIKLDSLPYTPNGKIDKKRLPIPTFDSDRDFVKARNDTDKYIINTLSRLLNVNNISITDSIFSLGGDSLTAISLSTSIYTKFKISISIQDILNYPIVKDLSDYISTISGKRSINTLKKADKMQYYPLSSAQKRIYLASSIENNSTLYNITGGIIVDESLNIDKLQSCFKTLISRHEVLRTHFDVVNDEIVQTVDDNIDFKLSLENTISDDLNEIYNNFVKPFDLSKAPLFRTKLVKLNNKILLLLDMHHIISDGTSLKILMQELCTLYNGEELSNKNINYTDFCVWEHEQFKTEEFNNKKEFWVNQFKNEIPLLNMPTTYSRPSVQSFEGTNYYANLSKETINKILETSNFLNITPYMLMLSCYYILLSKYTSQDDIVVGTPIAGREFSELSNMLGMFVNTLALRNKIDSSLSFEEFSKNIKENCLNSFKNQSYPFDMLVKDLDIKRDPSRNPLFDTMFSFQNEGFPDINFKDINSECYIPNSNISKFDISLDITPKDSEYLLRFEYCTKLFDKEFIARFSSHYINILNEVIDNIQIKISDIDMLSKEERNQILYEFNNTKVDYPQDKTIVDLFEEQVEKTPDNIAVVFEDQKLTYRELNEKANQLANYLISKNVKNGDVVGILLDKSLEVIVSMFAILKTGAAYLPLDIEYPQNRLEYILNNSSAKVILTRCNEKNLKTTFPIIYIDNNIDNKCLNFKHNINIRPSDLAYITYTSGSTGNPKGVMVTHRNVIRLVKNSNFITFSTYDRILQTGSIVFDASTFEIFGALLNGLSVYLMKKENLLNPELFKKYIIENNITILFLTTALFNKYCEYEPTMFKSLKYLLTGGEAVSNRHMQIAKNKNINLNLLHVYGPTENTTFSTFYQVEETDICFPIGKPITNSSTYVVDNYGKLCPIGVPGELWVGGNGVAKGYLNNENLTKEKFIKNPFGNDIIYKTGDLVKWLPDGNIEFIGRIDNQVKIRGFRIELSEIDTNILTYPNIKQAISIVQNINNNKTICSYIVVDNNINIHELKAYLSKILANYMIPTYITVLDKLPLNINGKIDRKLLPLPEISVNNEDIIKPRNELDKIILSCCNMILDDINISINENLLNIGIDSLSGINLAMNISKKLHVSVTVRDIFEYPTVQDLSDYIATISEKENTNVIPKAEKMQYYPLSSAQKRIYLASSIENNSTLYNITGGIIVDESLDIGKLQSCFKTLISRHDVLRTRFDVVENEVVQIIEDNIDFELTLDYDNTDDFNKIYTDFIKPFDLSKAPLFRTKLVKLNDNKMLLLLDMHHIISDGTSLGILLQELCDLYNDNELAKKELDYKDFTLWEKEQFESDEFKRTEEYWVNQFKDEIPLLNMPTTYPRPSVQSFEGQNYHINLSKEVFNKINEVARKLNITPYMLMLSCYYILLSKYTSQDDIVVGTPIVGRELPELSNMLGMFVNTLALKNKIDSSFSFEEFSKKIKQNCLNSFKNQSYPFDMLVKELNIKRDTSRSTLFDVMFIYQNNGYPEINFKNTKSKYLVPDNNVAKFDLSLEVIPLDNEYSLRFEYCSKLFDEEFIKRFSSHYINILNSVIENSNIKISDIDMLSEEEKSQILYEFNNTKVDYPRDKTIVDLFEEQVEKTPDNIAVVFEDQILTYRELNEKANQLARFLYTNNVSVSDIVGILLDKSLESIISILGVLKAGATFLPIDVGYPNERIEYIINDSKANIVLTNQNFTHKINDNVQPLSIDKESGYFLLYDYKNLNIKYNVNNTAYIMYTSGSTGNPKGVMVTHRNIVRLVKNNKFITFDKEERILQTGSIVFDACTFEIWGALLNGFKLFIMKKEDLLDATILEKYLEKNKITTLWLTAPLFNQLCETNPYIFKNVKKLLTGGDVLSPKHINMVRKANPNLTVINGYGPTENTTFSCCFTIDKKYISSIPIGTPISNSTGYVVNTNGKLCPIGVPGELWVGGDGVAKGYLNNETLTKEKFIQNPFDKGIIYKTGDLVKWLPNGNIEFIGRIDNQVKVRGFRVELGEINSKILAYPSINECITLIKDIKGEKTICTYYVSDQNVDIQILKQYLKKGLPNYMIPTHFKQMSKLPINVNGKIDKKLLPNNFDTNKSKNKIKEPINETQEILLNIFKKILSIEDIGINDDFFELGGDSLSAIKLQIEAISNNIDIKYADIFDYPTVEELAEHTNKTEEIFMEANYNYEKYDSILKTNTINKNTDISNTPVGNVLLTGFTGFLGAHVLDSFIKKEKGDVYCLIRGKNNITPKERLENVLHFYFDTKYDKYIGNRIKLIEGDITENDFGLNLIDYNILGTNIDTVIHCAALVKHYGTYKEFENINILGTKRIVDFCKAFRLKLLHISTISVSGNNLAEGANIDNHFENDMIFNETNFYIGQNLKNFYVRSKFEAERIVLDAILEGLQACILRMGNLTSRFSEGKFQQNHFENAFVNKIRSFIQIGCVPEYLLKSYCEFTPIDFCGDAIIEIANHITKGYTVFHLLNEKQVYLDRLFSMLNEIGINATLVSEKEFKSIIEKLLNDDEKRNYLEGIINDLDTNKKYIYKSDVIIESNFTKEFLSSIGFEWPYIDTNYIRNYFKYLSDIGYFNLNIN